MVEAAAAFTIFHNPGCGTSRNALALLRQAPVETRVIEYLSNPPSRQEIEALAARMGLPLRDIMRKKGTPYAELALDDPAVGTSGLLDAIEKYPILLNRPIVVGSSGAMLCRPSDIVLDLLSSLPASRLLKEEGTPFLKDETISPSDSGLAAALIEAGLPADDVMEPNRTFYTYATLDGERVGYGGFERHGNDVLIRSVVVLPAARSGGVGSGIVPLLLFRAFRADARQAYLLTSSAAPFFERLGFQAIDRDRAPASILSTRQAAALCPAGATLMTRKLGF